MRRRRKLIRGSEPHRSSVRTRANSPAHLDDVERAMLSFVETRVDPNEVDGLSLFEHVDLTACERAILDRLIDSTNVVRTGRFSDLIRKVSRIGSLLLELTSRGIAAPQVLESVDMPTAECERIALEYLKKL